MHTNTLNAQNRQRALVIDDEEGVRSIIRRSIELLGLRVDVAADGYQGLETFRSSKEDIDVVLLDLNMPRMSGRETLECIREIRKDVNVLIMSGSPVEDITDDFGDSSFVEFIQKPFQLTSLLQKVSGILDMSGTAKNLNLADA